MWLFDLFWIFKVWNNWLSIFSSLNVPSSVATSDHPAGGAMLSWPTKEICEFFEDSKFYKMDNVLSIVIITRAMLRTCAYWSGVFHYHLCICYDRIHCPIFQRNKVTVSSLKTWTIMLEFGPNLWFINKHTLCTNIYCKIIFWEI